jgi:hypothetical protein
MRPRIAPTSTQSLATECKRNWQTLNDDRSQIMKGTAYRPTL